MRRVAVCLMITLLAGPGCASDPAGDSSAAPVCLDDRLGALGGTPTGIPRCESDPGACIDSCYEGGSAACLGAAFTLESTPARAGEAAELFRRACAEGLALGCTNYGAHVLFLGEPSESERACAAKLFRRSCDAGESFACGMRGRMAFGEAGSEADRSTAGADLAADCERVGGFACRVLAKHVEAGDLGEVSVRWVSDLLKRACDTGDFGACGDPETAAETFR